MESYKVGDVVSGKITGITDYGVFLKLDNGYTGLIHISEISDKYISSLEKMYVLEETIESKILEIDDKKKQIKLSSKEFNAKANRKKELKEEGRGFEPLKENLDVWVKEKLEELEKLSKRP
jgi:predicted RNA-binding protein with RPS1 domain